MQDNALVRTALIAMALPHEMRIQAMNCSHSSDLNLFENTWAFMKTEIYRLYPNLRLPQIR